MLSRPVRSKNCIVTAAIMQENVSQAVLLWFLQGCTDHKAEFLRTVGLDRVK